MRPRPIGLVAHRPDGGHVVVAAYVGGALTGRVGPRVPTLAGFAIAAFGLSILGQRWSPTPA
ncbi:MAG: hypothetical protein R2710_28260 [Acidimicrobiales bacterium]